MNDFKGRHFASEIVRWAVRWYCRYAVGYRDLEAMMTERGVAVDHCTIDRWVQRFAPKMEKRLRWQWRRPRSRSWSEDLIDDDERIMRVERHGQGMQPVLSGLVVVRTNALPFHESTPRRARPASWPPLLHRRVLEHRALDSRRREHIDPPSRSFCARAGREARAFRLQHASSTVRLRSCSRRPPIRQRAASPKTLRTVQYVTGASRPVVRAQSLMRGRRSGWRPRP